MVPNPLSVNIMESAAELRVETINLHCDSDLNIEFNDVSVLGFYQTVLEKKNVKLEMKAARISSDL